MLSLADLPPPPVALQGAVADRAEAKSSTPRYGPTGASFKDAGEAIHHEVRCWG
ncbi:MAG: hypothetical protein JO288_10550 [Hyphomicrobiales bacterium]|nr:hypothetical protein [Hyphomicrobiales bacterium]